LGVLGLFFAPLRWDLLARKLSRPRGILRKRPGIADLANLGEFIWACSIKPYTGAYTGQASVEVHSDTTLLTDGL